MTIHGHNGVAINSYWGLWNLRITWPLAFIPFFPFEPDVWAILDFKYWIADLLYRFALSFFIKLIRRRITLNPRLRGIKAIEPIRVHHRKSRFNVGIIPSLSRTSVLDRKGCSLTNFFLHCLNCRLSFPQACLKYRWFVLPSVDFWFSGR